MNSTKNLIDTIIAPEDLEKHLFTETTVSVKEINENLDSRLTKLKKANEVCFCKIAEVLGDGFGRIEKMLEEAPREVPIDFN